MVSDEADFADDILVSFHPTLAVVCGARPSHLFFVVFFWLAVALSFLVGDVCTYGKNSDVVFPIYLPYLIIKKIRLLVRPSIFAPNFLPKLLNYRSCPPPVK
jgi:hypothetical protein